MHSCSDCTQKGTLPKTSTSAVRATQSSKISFCQFWPQEIRLMKHNQNPWTNFFCAIPSICLIIPRWRKTGFQSMSKNSTTFTHWPCENSQVLLKFSVRHVWFTSVRYSTTMALQPKLSTCKNGLSNKLSDQTNILLPIPFRLFPMQSPLRFLQCIQFQYRETNWHNETLTAANILYLSSLQLLQVSSWIKFYCFR